MRAAPAIEFDRHDYRPIRRTRIYASGCAAKIALGIPRDAGPPVLFLRNPQEGVQRSDTPRAMPYASADLYDRFLVALDVDDRALCAELALDLATCSNPLPGMACLQLGLPAGSTYACAARWVLRRLPAG